MPFWNPKLCHLCPLEIQDFDTYTKFWNIPNIFSQVLFNIPYFGPYALLNCQNNFIFEVRGQFSFSFWGRNNIVRKSFERVVESRACSGRILNPRAIPRSKDLAITEKILPTCRDNRIRVQKSRGYAKIFGIRVLLCNSSRGYTTLPTRKLTSNNEEILLLSWHQKPWGRSQPVNT